VKVAKDTFGKKLNSNDKIDGLNRAITGFAIAAGTSPRASVNFANGMLVGLGEMKKTEVGRQNAAAAAAKAAAGSGVSGEKSRQEFRYNAVFADAFKAALEENPDDQQAALRVATEIARGAAPDAPSAQGGGSTAPQGDGRQVAYDASGTPFYSTDGVNYVDAQGKPYAA